MPDSSTNTPDDRLIFPARVSDAVRLGEAEDRVGRGRDAGERREGHGNLERSGWREPGLPEMTIRPAPHP